MLTQANLKYLGAVRTPTEGMKDVNPPGDMNTLNYAQGPFTVDHLRGEYVFGTRDRRLVRLKQVPAKLPLNGNPSDLLDRNSVNAAPWVDGTAIDPSGVSWNELSLDNNADGTGLGGVQVLGDVAVIAGTIYYDANGSQDVSFLATEWPLPAARPINRTPWRAVTGNGQGWAAGPMAMVPEKYREALKGDMISGQCGLPIVTRQSFGPCAISWKANDLLTKDAAPSTMLVGYPGDHTTLGPWGGPANDLYNEATVITGMTFIGDNLVFIGSHGYGPAAYGIGTADPSLVGKPIPGSPYDEHWDAYDPTSSSKGCHAYPYRVQAWIYPVSELIKVVNGEKRPYDLIPTWFEIPLPAFGHAYYRPDPNLPVGLPRLGVNGIDYDSARKVLSVAVSAQDSYGWEPGPLVHEFEISGVSAEPNPLPPTFTASVPGAPPPVVVVPPPPPPVVVSPPPVVVPEDLHPVVEALKLQLANTKAALDSATLSRDIAQARIEAMRTIAQTTLKHLLATKGPAKWLVDALKTLAK